MDFASSLRATENGTRWKGIVRNSYLVPRRSSKIMGENRKEIELRESGILCLFFTIFAVVLMLYVYGKHLCPCGTVSKN